MARTLPLLALALALAPLGCRTQPGLHGTSGPVRVSPTALDFGAVAVGQQLALAVTLTDGAASPKALTVTVDGPFTAERAELEVPGGGQSTLTVTFDPVAEGAVQGQLQLRASDVSLDVALGGTGLAACDAGACYLPAFDFDARACVEQQAPDGTPCDDPCLDAPRCSAGRCVGNSAPCDDHDPCTTDSCRLGVGCLHTPVVCPVSDVCHLAACDPSSGCTEREVDDGTFCGRQTCATAMICLAGSCQTRAKPLPPGACSYVQVEASGDTTCARTVSGHLRCWGESGCLDDTCFASLTPPLYSAAGQTFSSLAAAPATVPIWAAVSDVVMGPGTTCAIAGGVFACVGDGFAPPAPLAGPLQLSAAGDAHQLTGMCARLDGGAVECWDGGEVVEVLDAGASTMVATQATVCALVGGQPRCAPFGEPLGPDSGVAVGQPPEALVADWASVLALEPGGALEQLGTNGSPLLFDAGVVAIGGTCGGSAVVQPYQAACAAFADAGVSCYQPLGPISTWHSPVIPGGVVQMSRSGRAHLCAVSDGGQVYCWGYNDHGQLGDDSVLPTGPVELVDGGATALALDVGVTLAVVDGRLRFWGLASFPRLDGGNGGGANLPTSWDEPDPGFTQLAAFGYGLAGVGCGLLSGQTWCWSRGQPLFALPGPDAGIVSIRAWNGWLGEIDADHRLYAVHFFPPTSPQWVADDVADVSESDLVLLRDGGLGHPLYDGGLEPAGVPFAASALSSVLFNPQYWYRGGACAIGDGGSVACFNGGASASVAGLWPHVRQTIGDDASGCALSGSNGVQCWGSNAWNGLGRPGPGAPTAEALLFDEPVVRLYQAASTYLLVYPHRCALLKSGRVLCWGSNLYGQLGLSPMLFTQDPVPVLQ